MYMVKTEQINTHQLLMSLKVLYYGKNIIIGSEWTMPRHVVVWSGGCDSTLILASLVDKYKDDPDNPIVAISLNTEIISEAKRKSEENARIRIKKKFFDKGFKLVNLVVKIQLLEDLDFEYKSDVAGLSQPFLWIANVLPYLGKDDIVYFGYIEGDHLWHYKSHFNWILTYAKQMLHLENISFETPLEWTTKAEVIKKLKSMDLYDDVWTCEQPNEVDVPCGKCHTCRVLAMGEKELEMFEVNDVEVEV